MSDTWQAMCVTHGMPCVNMHATFEAYIYGAPIQFVETRKGEREERKREREERKGEREEKERKGKKKTEEERGGREEKERGKGRSVAQWADPDGKEPETVLQEVGFLLLWLFYA